MITNRTTHRWSLRREFHDFAHLGGAHQGWHVVLQFQQPGCGRLPVAQHAGRRHQLLRRDARLGDPELHDPRTGDDCFAFWPAASDQDVVDQKYAPGIMLSAIAQASCRFWRTGSDLRRREQPHRGLPVYGHFPGCGILLSTTFPTADESRRIDNNFSGTTTVRNCELIRSGGLTTTGLAAPSSFAWIAATFPGGYQGCEHQRQHVRRIQHRGSRQQQGTGHAFQCPTRKREHPNFGIGADSRHGLWVRADASGSVTTINSNIADIQNNSANFTIIKE